jgi:hypothetical protein
MDLQPDDREEFEQFILREIQSTVRKYLEKIDQVYQLTRAILEQTKPQLGANPASAGSLRTASE